MLRSVLCLVPLIESPTHALPLTQPTNATDLKGQQAQAAQLGEVLSKGPLADVVKGLDNMLEPVDKAVTVRLCWRPCLGVSGVT